MIEKLKNLIRYLNSKGIPTLTMRDPVTQQPSVSLSMVVVSFGMCVIGLIGKFAGFLGGVNMSEALNLLQISCVLYFGRKVADNFMPNNQPPADPPPAPPTTVNISVDKQ